MKSHPRLHRLAKLVATADSALVAATAARGRDGHGEPLPDLNQNLVRALAALEEADRIAREIREEVPTR